MVKKHTNRGVTTWCYVFDGAGSSRAGRRRIRKFGFATKKAAEEAELAAKTKDRKAAALTDPSQAATLDVLLEKFFQLHCTDNLAGKTIECYYRDRAKLSPQLLNTAPGKITRAHWTAEWRRLRQEGGQTRGPLGAKTVRNIAATVSSAYSWAVHQDLVHDNPVHYSELPKIPSRRAVTVEIADVDRMLAVPATPGFWCRKAYVATAERIGARRGELLALRWSDLRNGRFTIARSLTRFKDPVTGQRHLEFKSTKENGIKDPPLPPSLIPILEEHRRQQEVFRRQPGYQDQDLIFAQIDGRPFEPDNVSAAISKLCRKLDLPKGTSLHSLRHTHATMLLSGGTPPATVSKRLGHRKIGTTLDIYGHALRQEDDRAATAYDEYRQKELQHARGSHDERTQ